MRFQPTHRRTRFAIRRRQEWLDVHKLRALHTVEITHLQRTGCRKSLERDNGKPDRVRPPWRPCGENAARLSVEWRREHELGVPDKMHPVEQNEVGKPLDAAQAFDILGENAHRTQRVGIGLATVAGALRYGLP